MRAVPFLLVLAACDSPVTYSGYQMDRYFPFDGQGRTWEFESTDAAVDHRIVATLDTAFATHEDGYTRIFSVTYDKDCKADDGSCTDAWIRDVRWSSDAVEGVRIWGYETAAGTVSYDPPIVLADPEMLADEFVTTETGGVTWTATFLGNEVCPVIWTSEWADSCIHISLDDGDGNPATGEYLAGDYWAITQYNVVGMRLTSDTGTWQLDYATYIREE